MAGGLIADDGFVEKMFFLFTPTAMTKAKLDKYKQHADSFAAKRKMQLLTG